MREKIYIATFSENAVEVIGRFGLGIELNDACISEYLDSDKVEQTIETMKSEIRDSGADRVILHGPFTEIIPASIDHRAVSMGMERLEEAYQVCRRMGIHRMVVHSGYMPLLYFKDWHHQKSVDFWRHFMENKPEDFNICIENVFEDEPFMMKKLAEELSDSRISLCLDVGHANAVTAPEHDILEWIEVLGRDIGHFHLHNNDGTRDAHGPVYQGTMDMKKILAAIEKHCRPDVTMTIESRTCEDSVRWLLEQEIFRQD